MNLDDVFDYDSDESTPNIVLDDVFDYDSDESTPNIVHQITTEFKPDEHHCMATDKNGDWLVYVDSKPNSKNYYSCFLWNHHLQAKVNLPCLLDAPESFFRCLVCCRTFLTHDYCAYRVLFFYNNDPNFIWCSDEVDYWDKIQYAPDTFSMCGDVVFLDSSTEAAMSKTYCTISRLGLLYFFISMIKIRSPNRYLMNGDRRLVVNYGVEKDRLFLLERRKPQQAWEVWEVDFLNQRLVRVFDLEGLVLLLTKNYSAAYSHRFYGNCICYTEEGDDDNFYVFWLANKTLSIFENQPNSGFPVWFPTTGHLRMPSFIQEDVNQCVIIEEPKEKENEITPLDSDEARGILKGYCQLPEDLQRLIAESIRSGADYANFRLACREWREIARPICWKTDFSSPIPIEIPWLMSFQEKDSCSSMIDPTNNMMYCKSNPELSGCTIHDSKEGWLLVTRGSGTIFFIEPFSNTKIGVVDFPGRFGGSSMSFSSSPTSSNWAIIGILSTSSTTLEVIYLRSDDKEWDHDFYEIEQTFISGCKLVAHDQKFFYLCLDGSLGVFYWENSAFKFKISVIDGSSFGSLSSNRKGYLVSCEDELYGVVIRLLGKYVSVYKLDVSASKWKEVKIVENFSFFISQTSSLAVRVTERAQRSTINFPLLVENRHLSYKLDASEISYYKDDNFDRDVHERKELVGGIWIQPKVSRKYR